MRRGLRYTVRAITYSDGIPRHPAPLYEMVFHWAMGFLLIALWRRHVLFGRLFAFYLASYGVFRFFTEYLRETPKAYGDLSAYQIMSLAMIVAGGAALSRVGRCGNRDGRAGSGSESVPDRRRRIVSSPRPCDRVLGLFVFAGWCWAVLPPHGYPTVKRRLPGHRRRPGATVRSQLSLTANATARASRLLPLAAATVRRR